MFENRSFDHLLGHLDHGSLTPITAETKNVKDVSNPDGGFCEARFLSGDKDVGVDPGHGFPDVVRQLTENEPREDGPPLAHDAITMGGFAWNYARQLVDKGKDPDDACHIMGCHTAEQLPVLTTLAREFAVCSQWFCSVPSETWPNRLFVHGAQSEGLLHNVIRPYTHRTTFDTLADAKVSWAVYAGDIPQAAAYFEVLDVFQDRFNPLPEFFEDVRDNTLPSYSFLEPRHFKRVDSQHPTHSVILGDQLLRSVYTALAANPRVWESTLLIVTWDEHGGFHDRVRPPKTVAPFAKRPGEERFAFDILGVRVPAVIVSPFIAKGTIDDEVHDHASVIRTVHEVLGVDECLTARDEHAKTVLPLLTGDEPRTPPDLPPAPSAPRLMRAITPQASPEPVELDDLQRSLVELTRLLDQHRAPRLRRLSPPVVQELPSSATPTEIDLLVSHFQHEHMGDRGERLSRQP
ncbi:MAG: phospholipase [Thermoleophilaceae bacterium]|jgi:phospholipase C|nr:phospholipase [Thermoleophilaceae bacterium]